MLPLLALELYNMIFQLVDDKTDLCSLALCCSIFRDEAQQCLFRDAAPTSIDRQIQFQSAINAAPLRLGPFVHSFCTNAWTPKDEKFDISLLNALRAMHRLKHFKLYSQTPSAVLHGCTFQLHTIACGHVLEGPEASFLLYDFLPTQKIVKRLDMHVHSTVELSTAPMDLCTQLEFMATNNGHLFRILFPDDRLISHLQWLHHNTTPPLTIHQLNHLKSLTLWVDKAEFDASFTHNLTSLVNFQLHIVVLESYQPLERLHFLKSIPHLQVLRLVVNEWYLEMSDEEFYSKFSASFQQVFEVVPGLKHIELSYGSTSENFVKIGCQDTRENDAVVCTRGPAALTSARDWMYLPAVE